MLSGVYRITNERNGMTYVGSTRDLERRRAKHWAHFRSGKHPNRYLARAVKKYGIESFSMSVLEYCEPEKLAEREQHHIEQHKAFGSGYNLLPNAYRNRGYKHTASARAKIRRAFTGRKFTDEHRERIAAALRTHKRTEAHARAISEGKKGKPSSFKGKRQPESAKAILRALRLTNPMPRKANGQFHANN